MVFGVIASTYEMSHGETFIIWLLMAILLISTVLRKCLNR